MKCSVKVSKGITDHTRVGAGRKNDAESLAFVLLPYARRQLVALLDKLQRHPGIESDPKLRTVLESLEKFARVPRRIKSCVSQNDLLSDVGPQFVRLSAKRLLRHPQMSCIGSLCLCTALPPCSRLDLASLETYRPGNDSR